MNSITRQTILTYLSKTLEQNPKVYALWLEGSDGTNSTDEFSDIDINVDVEDGNELEILTSIQTNLEELGNLDIISSITKPNEDLRFQVFHIEGTNKHLLIDVVIQKHSRNFSFCRQNVAETPVVIFDKSEVIRFHDADEKTLAKQLEVEVQSYKSQVAQSARVEKYISRQNFLEALVYYRKYILEPLVGLIRVIHTPLNTDYNLVKISQQIPPPNLVRIEYFYQISSLADIERKLPEAIKYFSELVDAFDQKV